MSDFPAWTGYKAIEFDANGLEMLSKPGVYMYIKRDKAIYVGSGQNVISRAFSRSHHKRAHFTRGVSLIIFPCERLSQALRLEQQLIEELQPILNGHNPQQTERLASALGINKNNARAFIKGLSCQPIQSE